MNWIDLVQDALLAGASINIVGLAGNGPDATLASLSDALDQDVFATAFLDLNSSDVSISEVDSLITSISCLERIPVLIVSGFEDVLLTDFGERLEAFLFAAVNSTTPSSNYASLRCVVSTTPRDREIVHSESPLRERCAVFLAGNLFGDLVISGKVHHEEHGTEFCASNLFLCDAGGNTPNQRRGTSLRNARSNLHVWVGQLDPEHQKRLERILLRAGPTTWQVDRADPTLTPLIINSGGVAKPPLSIQGSDIATLLIGTPWPIDTEVNARRMAARSYNEPAPLWADNFLTSLAIKHPKSLVDFLKRWLTLCPSIQRIRLLSRNWVAGKYFATSDIALPLSSTNGFNEIVDRVEWRLFDRDTTERLHRRELVLPRRRSAFTLPPCDVVVGEQAAGNETDASVSLASSRAVLKAWERSERITF